MPVGEWVGSGVFGVSSGGGGGSGTVTSVSVVSANGLAGTVANATTTPAITLSTTITGTVLSGNGTAISAATTTGTGSTVVLSASPALTGTPTAPTAAPGTNTTQIATTAFVAATTPASISAMHNLVRTAVKTTAYAAANGDLVACDSTSGGFTVTLPTAPADQALIEVKHIIQGITSGSGNIITVAAGGSDVINRAGGPTSVSIPINGQSRAFLYQSSTAIWTIVWAELPQTAIAVQTVTADPNPAVVGTYYRTNYAGNGNFTLPTSPAIGSWVKVKQVANNTLSIVGTVDGNASFTMVQFQSYEFIYNGTNWDIT